MQFFMMMKGKRCISQKWAIVRSAGEGEKYGGLAAASPLPTPPSPPLRAFIAHQVEIHPRKVTGIFLKLNFLIVEVKIYVPTKT